MISEYHRGIVGQIEGDLCRNQYLKKMGAYKIVKSIRLQSRLGRNSIGMTLGWFIKE